MKYKTQWDLTLLYKNEKDPQIEKDMKAIEKACIAFEKKYKGKDFISSSKKLLQALIDRENLSETMNGNKCWWYFALRNRLNSDDSYAGAMATSLDQRISNATNKIKFFFLEVSKISAKDQKAYLNDSHLHPFRYSLERIFNNAKYNLSEKEEQLAALLSQTSYDMWVDGQLRVLSQETIVHANKTIPLSKAMSVLGDEPKKTRQILHEKINGALKRNASFAGAEINAVYNFKKIMDERRGYKKSYTETVLGYENDEKTIEDLVAVVTKYFTLSQRFYSLHARLLDQKKITMADRSVKIGEIKKKFDFENSVLLVKNAFTKVDKKYADYLDEYLVNGQIDVYPVKGKDSGAFCWGVDLLPTFILLNHTDNVRSVETLAHEMGHAIHTEFSKKQPPRYRHYSTATAEVASTFFEQLAIDDLMNELPESERTILLHNKIMGDISTVFRQIACFNFEKDLHEKIRAQGQVDKDEIAKLLQKHLQSYTGKSMEVTQDDGYFYVTWSHIRRFFYVYSYAYGQIISRALYEKWKADPMYAKKIEQFLRAGRSMSPKDIFKSIGINTNAAFFEAGLKGIEADIDKLEKLSKNLLKNKKNK